MSKKPFLSRTSTKIYLESYLLVLSIIFLTPLIMQLILGKDPIVLSANILFFEFNLFLSLVLMIYTYFTRYENRNWKIFIGYFILSFVYLIVSMFILGGNIYF